MIFLHPLALLGLAAAAIPALLHLLERRVPPEAEFPPIRYLSETERQSARRLKLRHLLLLVLRTALIVLIVLAAARPLVSSHGATGGAHEPTALAVILDNSPSSGAVVDGHQTLERLKAAARGSIERAAPADRVWLTLADGVARAGSRDALLATIDSAIPGDRRLDLTVAVGEAAKLVEAEPLSAREVHVVSDLQRTAFGPGRPDVPRGVRVIALAPPAHAPPNRGVAAARVADGAVAITLGGTPDAAPAPVTVRLRPPGGRGGAGGAVEAAGQGAQGGSLGRGRDAGRALVAPGASASIPLPPVGVGWWVGEVVLDPDEVRFDDRRAFVWRVAPPARVRAQDVGPFVTAALAVLADGKRVADGTDVAFGERPQAGPGRSVVVPPADPALVGQVNRVLAARGGRWRFGNPGTPGPIAAAGGAGGAGAGLGSIDGIPVSRRYHLEGNGEGRRSEGEDGVVIARVGGDPWLVGDGDVMLLGSRLDTSWTALPASPAFVPFVDALVNRLARGEAPVAEAEGLSRVEFRTRGADTVGATVYGPDPRESDLTPTPADLVRGSIGAEVLDDARFAAERFAGTRRVDVSGVLLALALLVAAVELGIATLTH